MDAWWRAANYLSAAQIYLLDNPLLKEPLRREHLKPRLLGHWGTTPGLNFLYVHINRAIKERDLDAIYVIGPGHGTPGILANGYLEGTYSEVYPAITQDEPGLRRFFRQFSFPGGVPHHRRRKPSSTRAASSGTPSPTPLALHSTILASSSSASLAMVRQEFGPLAASWHSNKFLNPATDGAVVPVLHLNGYKIANPM